MKLCQSTNVEKQKEQKMKVANGLVALRKENDSCCMKVFTCKLDHQRTIGRCKGKYRKIGKKLGWTSSNVDKLVH